MIPWRDKVNFTGGKGQVGPQLNAVGFAWPCSSPIYLEVEDHKDYQGVASPN
jgi:hypothetical protein